MSKCKICNKENEGVICKHCLAKYANKAGKFAKGACKLALSVLPVVVMIATRGKAKTK